MNTVARPEAFSLIGFGKRLGLAIIVTVVSTIILTGVGAPETLERAIVFGAAVTAAFVGSYPPGTPHRWGKSVLAWGAHLVFFGGGMLLVNWWRGV